MIKEWFLLVIILVQPFNSDEIQEREIHKFKHDSEQACVGRIDWYENFYVPQLGVSHLTRISGSGTYTIGLNGTLAGVVVGCEVEERKDFSKWHNLDQTKGGPAIWNFLL